MIESMKENIDQERNNIQHKEEINTELNHIQSHLSDLEVSYLLATCDSQFETLSNILSKNPTLVNMKNPFCNGYTALHFACKFGKTDVIRTLIGNYKADVNIISHSGKTPLHVAVEFKQEEVARLLLAQYSADKSLRDYSGRLPADLVTHEGMDGMIRLVGPPTSREVFKPTKAAAPALSRSKSILESFQSNLRKSIQGSLSSVVSLDVSSKAFSLFRKGSEASPHTSQHQNLTVSNAHHKETPAHSSPLLLHLGDADKHNNIKKSLSFLSSRSSIRQTPIFKGGHTLRNEEVPKE